MELADGGTLFLDEIGELPLELQVKMLRLIQEGQWIRSGRSSPAAVDVRVIAATHRNLQAMIEDGTFREDLYYRLAVIPLELPPLRDRADDIPELVQTALFESRAQARQARSETAAGPVAATLRRTAGRGTSGSWRTSSSGWWCSAVGDEITATTTCPISLRERRSEWTASGWICRRRGSAWRRREGTDPEGAAEVQLEPDARRPVSGFKPEGADYRMEKYGIRRPGQHEGPFDHELESAGAE